MLQFEAVEKYFGSAAVVNSVTLEIVRSEFFALFDPSGCGKTRYSDEADVKAMQIFLASSTRVCNFATVSGLR
jgi:ABC-type iron transport system FetAB ATPase subunit